MKSKPKPVRDLVASLLARACASRGYVTEILKPLGVFSEIDCDAEWKLVCDAAAKLGGPEHVGEVIGDLMQANDDGARLNFAFCQTPGFVTEYLLDHVLVALDRFGLFNGAPSRRRRRPCTIDRRNEADQRIRLLDPSCGSGHILVRAVRRLAALVPLVPSTVRFDKLDPTAWACGMVTGYEINPEAAAVARVRLAMELCASPGRHSALGEHALRRILEGDAVQVRDSLLEPGSARFEMIVANPPYIVPKDAGQRDAIRKKYVSAHGKYGLHGPFMEAMTQLWLMPGGFATTIVSNSFMKREWGKKLVEEVFPKTDIRFVVNTAGAYIPGHGTPTCILGFRHGPARPGPVLALTSVKGEPGTPADPAQGLVWRAIRSHTAKTLRAMVDEPAAELDAPAAGDSGAPLVARAVSQMELFS